MNRMYNYRPIAVLCPLLFFVFFPVAVFAQDKASEEEDTGDELMMDCCGTASSSPLR